MDQNLNIFFINQHRVRIMDKTNENLDWVSVINFLQKQYTQSSIREKQWILEKQSLLDKIDRLQGQLDANKVLIDDLLKRIKLLEIALVQTRTQANSKSNRARSLRKEETNPKQLEKLIDKYNLEEKVQMKDHEEFLKKIMTEMKISTKPLTLPDKKENAGLNTNHKFQSKDQSISSLKSTGKIVAHMDAVRKIFSNDANDFLVTISEDCLVKIWNYRNLLKNGFDHIEPTSTFREHTGPLFALAGGKDPENPQNSLFFTGGNEGIVKYWKTKCKQFQTTTNSVGVINGESKDEVNIIWDLAFTNTDLLSSSSDGFIRLHRLKNSNFSVVHQFKQKQFDSTSVTWLSSETFLAGCSNAPRVHLWDLNGKLCQKYIYQIQKSKEPQLFQTNEILYNPTLKYIVSGCEDGNLRIFTHGSTKITRKIDTGYSISSIAFRKQWQIVAGMNDGSMGIWDMRNYKRIFWVENSHLCKFDEGVLCMYSDGEKILTGGSDGVLNIYT